MKGKKKKKKEKGGKKEKKGGKGGGGKREKINKGMNYDLRGKKYIDFWEKIHS